MSADADERFGDDDSVKECITIMNAVLAEQRERARHLDSKTGTLAGFCATTLTLNVVLGRELLGSDTGDLGNPIVAVCFAIAVVALTGALGLAVRGGLRPTGRSDLTEAQIDAYSDRPKVVTAPEDLRMRWLRTLTVMANSEREAGDQKAKSSKRSIGLLLIGAAGIAGEALIMLLTL